VITATTRTKQSRLAALIFVATALAALAWITANVTAYRDMQASYAVKSALLEDLKQRATARLGTSTPTQDADAAMVAAASETMAAGVLQRYLLDRLERTGGVVQSVQTEPAREAVASGLQRLSAQLAFQASTSSLQCLLFDLEGGLPFVFVDSLMVQPATTTEAAGQAADKLRVSLTVTSFWKGVPAGGAQR
jgi:general secretion pathway protein M